MVWFVLEAGVHIILTKRCYSLVLARTAVMHSSGIDGANSIARVGTCIIIAPMICVSCHPHAVGEVTLVVRSL